MAREKQWEAQNGRDLPCERWDEQASWAQQMWGEPVKRAHRSCT
jgi:hypothetical protein